MLGIIIIANIIILSRLLDEEEALEDLEENDADGDGAVTWLEYLKGHFSYSPDDIKDMRRSDRDDVATFIVVGGEQCLRWGGGVKL